MIVKDTGLWYPYADADAPGRTEIPPAEPESVAQRQTIAAVQEAETMESLQKVGVDLPEPQDVEIPSGGSPLAEAAQKGTGPLLTRPQQDEMAPFVEMTPVLKERVDFNKEEELPMWKAALMTATNQWLSSPVGMGLTPGEPSEPEELEAMSTSRLGFSMLAKGIAKRVGDMHSGEGIDEYMKRAAATTTPIINAYVSW